MLDPDKSTILPDTMRDCSDLVFCVNVFTTFWRLQLSGEKSVMAREIFYLANIQSDADAEPVAAP